MMLAFWLFSSVDIQAGNTTSETITLSISTMTTTGLSITSVSVSTQANAQSAITTMDTALETIASEQATLGSYQNRLTYSVANLSQSSVMTEQALGRIMDTDFATESTALQKLRF